MDDLGPGDPDTIGPYRPTARIGAGGMGVVYLATGPDGHLVAVKLIRSELAADPAFRARFAREVRAGQRVGGMCTARYLDADLESEHPYLVTEFVEGGNLFDFVRTQGPLHGERLVGLAVGLAEGLVAMGAAGVIHRDLKPSNVLMAERGPKVVDFGISHAADGTSLTQTGAVVGSPSWMAPEQAQGRESGPAVDVFSWGATMAFAATGRAPFGEGRPEAIIYRVVHEEPELGGVDQRLQGHIRAALAKEPSLRPRAEDLLVGVIKTAMAGEPTSVDSTDGATEVLERTWVQPRETRPTTRRRRQVSLLAVGLVVIAAATAGAVYMAHGGANSPGTASLTAHRGGTHHKTGGSATTTTKPTAVSTTTMAAASSPTADVSASLPVVACPTSYAIEPAPAAKALPSTMTASVPADLTSQASVYADEAGILVVLAPTGWDCTASVGADGSSSLDVLPSGEVLPNSSLAAGSTLEAITAGQTGGCQGCAGDQACPFFAAAVQSDGDPCPTTPPSEESVVPLSSTVVSYSDPPDYSGDAQPSGGEYPANGVTTYVTNRPGSQGNFVQSWIEDCTLPYSQQAMCTAVLNDFASHYGG